MIVTLIPLFLAANVAVNEIDWKYGPEAVYNVQVNAAARSPDAQLRVATTNSTLKLKCRSESDLVLNCRFREIRYVSSVLNRDRSWSIKDVNDFGEDGPGEDAFQLHFCPDGFNYMVVSSSVNPARLDMIRSLAGQLNVGTDLSEENRRNFDAVEKSAAGICNAICHWSNGKPANGKNDDKEEDKYYEFVNVRGSIYSNSGVGELEKIRVLDDCIHRTNYVYGTRETGPDPQTILVATLVSSKSKMSMTKNKFTSSTENVAEISTKRDPSPKIIVEERIMLTLADIVPAMGPIPKINNATRVRIYPTTGLRDEYPNESMDNESISSEDPSN